MNAEQAQTQLNESLMLPAQRSVNDNYNCKQQPQLLQKWQDGQIHPQFNFGEDEMEGKEGNWMGEWK